MGDLFETFDSALIRQAKNCEVEVESLKRGVLYLKIDEYSLRVSKENGLKISCPCEFCATQGVANGTFCRRKLRALWFLIQKNGRIFEMEAYAKKK